MASAPILDLAPFDPEQVQADPQELIAEQAGGIVNRLLALAGDQVRLKILIEQRWLDDLRAYHGRYTVDVEAQLTDKKRSRAFINLARAKANAWAARLGDLLFPADGKNWGISPTPVPELTESAKDAAARAERHHAAAEEKVAQANAQPDQQGALLAQAAEHGEIAAAAEQEEEQLRGEQDIAQKCAEMMEREIEDQLLECRYPQRSRDMIDDATKIGVGIMKGPITGQRPRRKWAKEPETNVYQLSADPDPRPEFRRVDPWAFFPQMNATSMEDCEFTFERHIASKTELRKMAKRMGFSKAAVRNLILQGPDNGSANDLHHLNELRSITNEGESVKDRYVIWEYHGPLEPEEIAVLLRSSGDAEDYDRAMEMEREVDPLDDHMVVCWFCNDQMLKIHPDYAMESGENLYSVFSFEKGEASILGAIGIPRIIMDALRAANGAWRMMLDNAALSVGPQIVVDKSLIEPENNEWTLSAMKVWLKTGQEIATSQGQAPFQIFNIPMNQQQLAGIIELALKFIDEEASLPMIAQGEQGVASPTLGGMSMLFNSANVVFRRVVRNWDDDLTEPNIRRIYDWNMQFNRKESIKGDLQVVAQGTSVLLVREMMATQLAGIVQTWTVHPKLSMFVKKEGYDAARSFLQALSMNPDTILDDWDTVQQRLQKMAETSGQNDPEMVKAQTQMQIAQLDAESREKDGQVQLQIADMRRQTELIKMAEASKMTVEDLKTKLAIHEITTNSKERMFAGELGYEAQNAAAARAAGHEPTGSGGYISAGETNS
jgi:hypothetical protein